ncbi:MAG TPA: hypothetical protein VHG88_10250 [Burkholderiales bacterium]|nr:hypothetical protein [Burkholderiales bacterium]
MTRRFSNRLAIAAMLVSMNTPVAHSQPSDAAAVPIEELKNVYLSCNQAASDGRLDTAHIMYCSMVYEELKRRAFEGDFDRLLAWSRAADRQISAAPIISRHGAAPAEVFRPHR